MTQDPVQNIKDEESKAQKKIKSFIENNQKELEEKRIAKEKDLETHKEELRKKGQASLETAKQEAMKTFKQITDEEDQKRSSIISQAKAKKDEGVKLIASYFEKHLVK